MEAKDYILTKFIDDKYQTFLVPLYQRKYKWGKTEIKELINDINEFKDDESLSSYFLGSIVIKKSAGLYSKLILVDGQQRITTLFLMCSALYDLLKSKKQESSTLGIKVYTILETDKDKFKLSKINAENIIQKIMKGNVEVLTNKEKKTNYFLVYDYFRKFFKKENGYKALEDFFYKGISRIKVAIINLEYNEDEFLVFESINSKGQHLSSPDLIKNYIVMSLLEKSKEDLVNKFENTFIEKINEKDLGDLYRQTLAIKTGELYSLNGKQLYYKFKKLFPKNKINESFIKNKFYDLAIFMYFKNKNWENKILPLESQIMNFYSLIHLTIKKNSYFKNEELVILNEENIKYVLKYLSKLVVARTLCGFGRVESNRRYAKMSNLLEKELTKTNKFKDTFNKIVIKKLENTPNRDKMPTKEEIEKVIMENDIYSNKSTLKWILIALEQNETGSELLNSKKISIEHIFPQNANLQNYQGMTSDEISKMKLSLHTFGNLSITHHNASLSNKSFLEKKKILMNKSYLKINKMIYEEEIWNYETVKKRAHKLLKKIFDFWWN